MTQNNTFRKEPTFGEPASNETSVSSQPSTVSLHSTTSPGFTFTKPLQRPVTAETEANLTSVAESTETVAEKLTSEKSAAPSFTFTPVTDESAENTAEINHESEMNAATSTKEPVVNPQTESVKAEAFTTERVIPTTSASNATHSAAEVATAATVAAGAALAKSDKPKMSAKVRRLLLLALLALALLVVFFLLKPSTPETVEELQSQQGSSLPIEFRPVDEAEAKRAEEQARAEQEALMAQQAQQEMQAQQEANQNQAAMNEMSETANSAAIKTVVENKPVVEQPVIRPQTQGSVVYQAENEVKKVVKAEPKVERLKPAVKETVKVAKPVVEKTQPVVNKAAVAATPTPATSATAASSKTLTVPKGVSLMQVFRDNNLNISDVNSMSKVNNKVSNLKAGERVTVRLDKNNRVVEMTIGSGGKFTRQANGSYTFK